MRLHGHGIRVISEMLGVSRGTARADIQKELAQLKEDNLEIAKGYCDKRKYGCKLTCTVPYLLSNDPHTISRRS